MFFWGTRERSGEDWGEKGWGGEGGGGWVRVRERVGEDRGWGRERG